VTAGDGPVLVIAAAGTGKTRTLTHRLAWLMEERRVPAWRIWLLTFTNRAAREMLERAGELTGDARQVWGGTFHHIANRILRRHAERLGYRPDFAILDEDDSAKIVKRAIDELGYKGKTFPKPEVILSALGLATSRQTPPEEEFRARFGETSAEIDQLLDVARVYGEMKRERNAMDFDDLLVNAIALLRGERDVAEEYQEKVLHVLVDEYQDTNRLQSDFVDLLAAKHGNLMAVGDDFQSIYSWRGADVNHILTFAERHPGARIIKLEQNYRSVPDILDLANGVIAGNPEQFQKTLRAARGEGVRPVRVDLANGRHQAQYVADQIEALLREGVAADEIAVLYRAHFHSTELEMELQRRGIPHVLTSGVRFFEQAHVKDLCAPLRLAANPGDRLAFERFAELFPKVGPKKASSMWEKLGGACDLASAETRAALGEMMPRDAKPAWDKLCARSFGTQGGDFWSDPGAIVKGFEEGFYREYAALNFDNADLRLEDAQELVEQARRFGSLREFIEEMALLTNLDGGRGGRGEPGEPAVRLSTVHQAKGLEWRAVFVLWLVDEMFPGAKALQRAWCDGGSLSEERRLFYVAVTRAKDRLWLCVPKTRRGFDGSLMYCEASTFVREVDGALMAREEPTPPGGGFSGGWSSRGMRW
jgi:DNA helicase-2/ATP-dependent DNA helicase PcrA